MKNKCLYPALCAFALLSTPLMAQTDDAPTSKPNAIAPYKTAIGLRLSPTPMYGSELVLTAKHFIRPESALEAQVGFINYNRGFMASLQYVWQPQLLTSKRFRPYAGIGLGITGSNFNRHGEQQSLSTNVIGLASFGIEYSFAKLPLALSLDYRHAFAGYKTDYDKHVPLKRLNNVGFGLKYRFGK